MAISMARASSSSGSLRPSIASARSSRCASAAASSGLNTSTRARDRSAAFSSKDGFSVVAPTSVTVPSSITGRKESCCARLKRWISSTKSSVPLPGLAAAARRLEHLLEVGDAGKDRRDLLELKVGLARQQPRDGGLAGAGRPPEDERAERAGAEHAGKRAVGAEQVVLADDVGQLLRPQPVGQAGAAPTCRALRPQTATPSPFFPLSAHFIGAIYRVPWRLRSANHI